MPYVSVQELLERNKAYAGPDHIPRPLISEMNGVTPHTMVISCFDPRSSPEDFLKSTSRSREIVCVRNAGGHPQHSIHDIAILDHLLEVRDIMVVHHQDCGMTHITHDSLNKHFDQFVSDQNKKNFDYEKFDFNLFTKNEIASSCRKDVEYLRTHPWIRPETTITGYYLDIKTGLLEEV